MSDYLMVWLMSNKNMWVNCNIIFPKNLFIIYNSLFWKKNINDFLNGNRLLCFYGWVKENDAIPCLEIVCLTKCTSNISSLGGYATQSTQYRQLCCSQAKGDSWCRVQGKGSIVPSCFCYPLISEYTKETWQASMRLGKDTSFSLLKNSKIPQANP